MMCFFNIHTSFYDHIFYRDEEIMRKSGIDAVQYLQFQRYLIVLMVIIVVFSLGVILPVNFSGIQEQGTDNFGRTTISNIPVK